ncbi:hypothetical protein TSTA_041660 [Talaromyces stipitatus ATCC 10500]|uniref:Uncharacterized protein n=1 Tax=Talaromyces stipitatus (strain ATCC 10500 / CBS 375.48 / QM 6759 / NRRL 1006) TaxID=441959 RepID=B8MJ99_TALSN|nr:uncharacterized protein TSTA_041660 [Talaromyces stipitatus ATCC 10500]EED14688.1 hypothetical protein TSTA_041660 [Talaromyces stipitatus ATCC 10500]
MKSGEHRDRIAKRERVIGFEMEGAGIWDNMTCIIIEGVCNYTDSHKNKQCDQYVEEITPEEHERKFSTRACNSVSREALTAVLKANFRNYGPAADTIDKGPGCCNVYGFHTRGNSEQLLTNLQDNLPRVHTISNSMSGLWRCLSAYPRRNGRKSGPCKASTRLDAYSETPDSMSSTREQLKRLLSPYFPRPETEQENMDESFLCSEIWSKSYDVILKPGHGIITITLENKEGNDTVIVEPYQEKDLGLFVRPIGLEGDVLRWETEPKFSWAQGPSDYSGNIGIRNFSFEFRKDLQIL